MDVCVASPQGARAVGPSPPCRMAPLPRPRRCVRAASLMVFLMCFIFAGIIYSFLPFNTVAEYFYCVIGALIFSAYIVFDTYMILNRLSQEEYILAAIDLYALPARRAPRVAFARAHRSRVRGCGGPCVQVPGHPQPVPDDPARVWPCEQQLMLERRCPRELWHGPASFLV